MITDAAKKVLSTETKKVATRTAYGETITALGEINENIVALDCDLSKSTMTAVFAKKFPERFFNFGIAEANMMSAAAGLATIGKIPFVSTFAVFATKRVADQISSSIAYPHLNVKICATHAGVSVGEDGATHQAIEDVAIMRAIPGIVVLSPCDAKETEKVIEAVTLYNGPCYVRLTRSNIPVLFNDNYKFEIGKGIRIMEGSKATLISTGFMTHIAFEAAKKLEGQGIEIDFINMPSIKPLDEELVLESAKKTKAVITVEDHSIIGGLGSAVCELLSDRFPVRVTRMGVQDKFGASGETYELIKAYGFGEESIIETVKSVI